MVHKPALLHPLVTALLARVLGLGAAGYGRDTIADITCLVREHAVACESACTQAPHTLPSRMIPFTGRRPRAHCVLVTRVATRNPRRLRTLELTRKSQRRE